MTSGRPGSRSLSVSPVGSISRSTSRHSRVSRTGLFLGVTEDEPQSQSNVGVAPYSHPLTTNERNTAPEETGPPTHSTLLPEKPQSQIQHTEYETQSPGTGSNGGDIEQVKDSRPTVGRYWWWELLSCIFSLVCMGAVIGVLAYEDGKPLDQWSFHQVTPNAVVSFIATLAKSSFLLVIAETISQQKWIYFHSRPQRLSDLDIFDQASRGPLGSLQLLVFRHKNALIASSAAIVTILALFVDPFVQLVFAFPSQGTLSPIVNATFLTTQVHDPMAYEFNTHLTHTDSGSVDTKMQAAMLLGLYNGTTPTLISCNSGNCTWNSATTLGVCGGCTDISAVVKTYCPPIPALGNGASTCNYTLNHGASLQGTTQLLGATGLVGRTRWNATSASSGGSASVLDALGGDPTLVVFQGIQIPAADPASHTITQPPIKAFECGFSVCAKTYSEIRVTNGVVHLPNIEETNLIFDPTDNLCLGDRPTGECLNGRNYFNLIRKSSEATSSNETSTKYRFNMVDFYNIAHYLEEMFSTGWTDYAKTTRQSKGAPQATAPDVGRELANSPDLNKTIIAIAASMTEAMRTGPNSTEYHGQVYIQKTIVRIRWAWLAYPIILTLMSMILLVLVILQTRQHDIVAWKSSSLALLLHNLSGWEMPDHVTRDKSEVKRIAKRLRVRFDDDGNRPAFVKEE
ncbi:MAG: hypothetical protein Q9218_002919 [Villophora microphyllina]